MRHTRIVERTRPDGQVTYVIQEPHFLFGFWDDAWVNHDVSTEDSFATLAEAKANLWQFDGSKSKDKVVYDK